MDAHQMWKNFSTKQNVTADYEAWAFGDDPDALAKLVLEGTKTATASLDLWYDLEGEPLPQPGEYSVILNSNEEAVCIIRTERVYIVPFRDVDERQAFKEGEGDRTLSYWKKVHEAFFSRELQAVNIRFADTMNVVCEEFIKVYP